MERRPGDPLQLATGKLEKSGTSDSSSTDGDAHAFLPHGIDYPAPEPDTFEIAPGLQLGHPRGSGWRRPARAGANWRPAPGTAARRRQTWRGRRPRQPRHHQVTQLADGALSSEPVSRRGPPWIDRCGEAPSLCRRCPPGHHPLIEDRLPRPGSVRGSQPRRPRPRARSRRQEVGPARRSADRDATRPRCAMPAGHCRTGALGDRVDSTIQAPPRGRRHETPARGSTTTRACRGGSAGPNRFRSEAAGAAPWPGSPEAPAPQLPEPGFGSEAGWRGWERPHPGSAGRPGPSRRRAVRWTSPLPLRRRDEAPWLPREPGLDQRFLEPEPITDRRRGVRSPAAARPSRRPAPALQSLRAACPLELTQAQDPGHRARRTASARGHGAARRPRVRLGAGRLGRHRRAWARARRLRRVRRVGGGQHQVAPVWCGASEVARRRRGARTGPEAFDEVAPAGRAQHLQVDISP
jgi:hypothetical protein